MRTDDWTDVVLPVYGREWFENERLLPKAVISVRAKKGSIE